MKLRLHAGTLRLRLSRTEIATLEEQGRVEDTVVFSPNQSLRYSIESGKSDQVTATFDHTQIRVVLPAEVAKQWTASDETGVEGSTGTLRLLIEKDFQCLHRPPEPGEDPFPNPDAKRF